jgi:hypothetical protein
MAPDLLLHPIFDVAEALTGVSNREEVHPFEYFVGRIGTALENRCASGRRNVVAITLRGSRDHISGDR